MTTVTMIMAHFIFEKFKILKTQTWLMNKIKTWTSLNHKYYRLEDEKTYNEKNGAN